MIVLNGTIIVWTDKGGRVFNDREKANRYFIAQAKADKDPVWETLFAPVKKPYGNRFLKDRKEI